jgi:pimeloyl-ACP methyl ester carboxylesterase
LLILVGVCRIASAAVADDGSLPALAGDPSPVQRAINWLAEKSDDLTVAARHDSKSKAQKAGSSGSLTTEPENSEELKKLAAESLYPPTAAPQKLTLEQLEAISKLAPKPNRDGVKVHPAMLPLFKSMVLQYTGGTYDGAAIRFRLHAPEPYQKGKKYPLVVWLHGAGECGSDNINQLSHLHHIIPYLVGPKKRDFFLLVPQCPHTHVSWEAAEVCSTTVRADGGVECHVVDDPVALGNAPLAFTLAMVDAVMKQFPIDPNRVTVAGLSTGGDGTWRILERRPDLFAAAAPVVSWQAMQEKSLREKPLLKKIPIWAIYSSDDRAIDFARKEFERMRERGCHVCKTEFGVCGHRAWTPAMLQGDVFGWLISRAKKGDRFYAAEASPTSPEKVGIFADVTDGDLKRKPTKAKRSKLAEAPAFQPSANSAPTSNGTIVGQPTARPFPLPAYGAGTADVGPTPYGAPTVNPPSGYRRPSTGYSSGAGGYVPLPSSGYFPLNAATTVEQFRLQLIIGYLNAGQVKKALAVADKIKNRQALVMVLLHHNPQLEALDFVDRELDRMEQRGERPGAAAPYPIVPTPQPYSRSREEPLKPIPAGKQTPMEKCGKEWAMSPTTLYGLFPNGWDQEANHVPAYVVNETGKQLRHRLAKIFANNDLPAMKEFCDSFIRLDDIPLSSPWFDTSGGRLKGRIRYSLNEKAKPVVDVLRDIAAVKAESKKELVELARKSLARIDAITNPKTKE